MMGSVCCEALWAAYLKSYRADGKKILGPSKDLTCALIALS